VTNHLSNAIQEVQVEIAGLTCAEQKVLLRQWQNKLIGEYPDDKRLINDLFLLIMGQIESSLHPIIVTTMTDNSIKITDSNNLANIGTNSSFRDTMSNQMTSLNQSTSIPPPIVDALRDFLTKLSESDLREDDKIDITQQIGNLQKELQQPEPDNARISRYLSRTWDVIKTVTSMASVATSLWKLLGHPAP
jgi:hypothetical protein